MIRSFAARLCAVALIFAALILPGCLNQSATSDWELSHDGEIMYNLLVQMEAAASGDVEAFTKAGERLLELAPDEGAYLEMAEFSLRQNRFEEARVTARKGLIVFPQSLPLALIISDSYLQQEKNQEASDSLLDFIKDNPDNQDAVQELARIYLVGERYGEFDTLLKTIPAANMTPYLHYVKARALLNRNRLAEGERELRLVVKEAPEMIDAWVNLGIALQLQGKYSASIPMFRKAVDSDPENLGLWLRLVDGNLRAKRPSAALKAVNEVPYSEAFLVEAAMLFVEAKQYTTARKLFLQVRDTPGSAEEVHLYLAALAMDNLNNPSEALRELSAISTQSPLAERALRWRLQILEEMRRMTEAVAVAKQYADENPGMPVFQVIYAQAAGIAGDRTKSITILREARKKWPDNPGVAFNLAAQLDLVKEHDEAMKLMEYVISVEPRNAPALNYVGYTLADAGQDLDRAYELIVRAVAEAPEDPHITDSLAWALYRLGKYDESWEVIRKSILLGGDHPTIWEHYGDIALKIGNRTEARKGYNKALKLNPDDPDVIRKKMQEL